MRAPEKHKIIEKKSIKQKPSKEEDQKSKQKVSEVQSAQPLSLKVLNHRKREGGGFDYLIDVDSQKKWYKDKDVEDFNDEIREYWRNTKH